MLLKKVGTSAIKIKSVSIPYRDYTIVSITINAKDTIIRR